MSTPPRDFREWMRSVERKLAQAVRTGNSAAVTALKEEAATIREEIIASAGDPRVPAAPTEFTVQTSLHIDDNGRTYGRLLLDFTAVTKATDATNLSVDYYELWGRDETEWDGEEATTPEYKLLDTANVSTFYSAPFTPGSEWRFRVRAIGTTTPTPGLWSVDTLVAIGADTTPPPIPSAVVLSQQYSVITIEWDGLAANGAGQPADYSHTEIAIGGTSSPTGILTLFRGADSTVVAGRTLGVPTFVRSRSVDFSGNKSSWSAQRQITPTALVSGDISGLDVTLADQIARSEAAEAAALASAADAQQAATEAAAAQASAAAAQGEADTAASEAAASAASAATLNAEAAAARAAADQAAADAAAAEVAATEAEASAAQALADLQYNMLSTGRIIRQENAPTGDDTNANNLWIKDSTGESFTWDTVDLVWELVDNATYAAAAAAADAAADRAEAAEAAAVQAELDATAAQTAAAASQSSAAASASTADAAEAAALAAETRAAAAETAAEAAEARATSAEASADQALADLQTELGTSAKIIRQETAPTGDLQREGVLWIKDSTGESFTWDESLTVPAWVAVDNEVIAQLAADADAAADRAEAAETAATAAQGAATAAEAEAEAARSQAVTAQGAATTAQNAAVAAQNAADAAEARADAAEAAAAQSAADASQSMTDLQAYLGTSGRTIYQEAEPTGEDRNRNNLWIKPSDGSSYTFDPAASAGAGDWVQVVNAVVAQAAYDADAARDAADAAEASAAQSAANALAAQQAASAAEDNATALTAAAQQSAADAAAADQRAANAEAAAVAAEANAAQSMADVQTLMETSGRIIYQDAEPAVADQNPNNLWIKDSTGEAFAWDSIQADWVLVQSDTVTNAALNADAAADRAEAAEAAAVTARNDATTAQGNASAAQTAANTAKNEATTAKNAATTAQQNAAASATAAQNAQAAADQSFNDLQGFLDDAGKIMRQDAEPAVADRNVNNLWIKNSTGEPFTWVPTANGGAGAWVIVTDQRVVEMAAAADAAADAAEQAELDAQAAATASTTAQQNAAASAGTATTAQQNAQAAQAAANQAQAEADAAAAAAAASAADAAQSANDADAAAQAAGSSSAAALVAQEAAEAAQTFADEAVATADAAEAAAKKALESSRSYVNKATSLDGMVPKQGIPPTLVDSPGAMGEKAFQKSGTGHGWWHDETQKIAYDPTALYRLTARVRIVTPSTAGGTGFYWGFAGFLSDGVTLNNASNANSYSSQQWVHQNVKPAATGAWVDYVCYYKGVAPGNSTSGGWTALAPKAVSSNTRYVVPSMILDYNGGNGVWEISHFSVDVIDDAGHQALVNAQTAQDAADQAIEDASTASGLAGGAQDTADAALSAATHAGKAFFSADPPSGLAPKDSTWQQYDVDGKIIGSWQQTGGTAITDGSTWTKRQLTSAQFDNFDAGKITFGTMSGQRITAGTLAISVAEVPALPTSKITNLDTSLSTLTASAQAAMTASAYSLNPSFDDWTGSRPAGTVAWGSTTPTKDTTSKRVGAHGMNFNITSALTTAGVNTSGMITHMPDVEYVTFEVEFMLKSGTLSGAGIQFSWNGKTNNTIKVDFFEILPTVTLNKWHRLTVTVPRNANSTGTLTSYTSYLFANYDVLPSPRTVKNITFDWLNMRPATEQEIDALLAKQSTDNWVKTGTTFIDGGKLFNDSVTTLALAANAVEADNIKVGAVTAVKLEAELILTTAIIAGDPDGTHAVMDESGFRVFSADPADGIPNEVVRMGVAATDDYFAITKADGTLAATISQDGVGSFAEVNANDELYYRGERLSTVLGRLPRGPLYKAELSADIDNITTEYGLVEGEYISDGEDRQIELELGIKFYPNQAGDEAYANIRYTSDGSTPTINSPRIFDASLGVISNTSYDSKSFKHTIRPSSFIPNYAPGQRLRFLMTVKRGNGSSLRVRGGLHTYMYINDVGPGIAHSPSFNPGGGTVVAPPPPVPAKQNYVRQYGCYNSMNYQGNNNQYNWDTGRMYQGLSPAGYGNTKSIGLFDRSAITGDLAGASIQYVRVIFNFEHWYYNAGGTARIGVHGHTGIPGTFSDVGPLSAISSGWPKPGARWVDLPGEHWGGFQSGGYCGVYLEGDGSYQTYGYSVRPTLEIGFAK